MNKYDLSDAIIALSYIPADLPREQWVRIGMAFHALGGDFHTFDNWSSSAPSYKYQDCLSTWKSFKNKDDGVSGGTLFYVAKKYGWNPNAKLTNQTFEDFSENLQKDFSKLKIDEIWNRSLPATHEHPYIVGKNAVGVPLDNLRVLPENDPYMQCGERLAGSLIVPVMTAGNRFSSLQFITPPETATRLREKGKPDKLNLPGYAMKGFFTVGQLLPKNVIYICEGIGAAWSCWLATGHASVACFGAGNMDKVATQLRQDYPSAQLVIVPDVGKEKLAIEIATKVEGSIAVMPEGWSSNSDVSDLADREGLNVLTWLLNNAKLIPKAKPRFELIDVRAIRDLPPMDWRVKGIFPTCGLVSIFGNSGSGKSFLAFDLACAIALGKKWFNYRVQAAPVVYAALEAEGGFRVRSQAWEVGNGCSLPHNFHMMLNPFQLTNPADVQEFGSLVTQGSVIVLDTLNRAAPTSDENSSKDMGILLEAAKLLQILTNGLVLLVHHSGKVSSKGMRGHSSLFAAMDGAIEVTRNGDRREWQVAKSKDGIDSQAHQFKLLTINLGIDMHGEEITSCVVRSDDTLAQVTRVRIPQGGNQRLVYDAIQPLFKDGVFGKPGAPALRPCISLDAAVLAGASRLTCESHRRNTKSRETLSSLVTRGVLGLHDGWLWTAF